MLPTSLCNAPNSSIRLEMPSNISTTRGIDDIHIETYIGTYRKGEGFTNQVGSNDSPLYIAVMPRNDFIVSSPIIATNKMINIIWIDGMQAWITDYVIVISDDMKTLYPVILMQNHNDYPVILGRLEQCPLYDKCAELFCELGNSA